MGKDNMKNLRVSSYLNEVDIGDGTSLLFNGLTLCIDIVPNEYARLLADGCNLSFLSPEEKQHLLGRGHLTVLRTDRRDHLQPGVYAALRADLPAAFRRRGHHHQERQPLYNGRLRRQTIPAGGRERRGGSLYR